jgi:hypothetical protein
MMQTTYVLGAGASCFAGFPLAKDLLPFLRSEFNNARGFQLKDLWRCALVFIDEVKENLPRDRILKNGEPDLEIVLSVIDRITQNTDPPKLRDACLLADLDRVITALQLRRRELAPIKQGFLSLVTSAFQYKSFSFLDCIGKSGGNDILRVSKAWSDRLSDRNTLVTFNWDLVQEILLSKAGKWSFRDGYGVQALEDSSSNSSSVTILKPHGSCNWALRHDRDLSLRIDQIQMFFNATLDDSQYPLPLDSTSDYGTSLIVPSYLKDPFRVSILHAIWREAAEKLRTADRIVVIGYSLPSADSFAQKLFQNALERMTRHLDVGKCCARRRGRPVRKSGTPSKSTSPPMRNNARLVRLEVETDRTLKFIIDRRERANLYPRRVLPC